jgi:hypothetical protein
LTQLNLSIPLEHTSILKMLLHSLLLALAASTAQAHTMGWAKGMYCLGGNNTEFDDANTNLAVLPLYMLPKEQWWFQADRGCDKAPPTDGDFLTLPAGGTVTLEMAHNRGQTTLSFGGQYASDWPDGKTHDENWSGPGDPPDCIQDDGAMHRNNQSMAAGTALAISYQSDITAVTMENLAVFTVLEQYGSLLSSRPNLTMDIAHHGNVSLFTRFRRISRRVLLEATIVLFSGFVTSNSPPQSIISVP